MRILELDAGNSRLKWRLIDSDTQSGCTVSHGFLANSDDWENELPRLLGQIGPVDCARGAIVSGDERFELLSTAVNRHFNIPLLKAEVKPLWRGLRVAYPGIGVDRWLAMLAAHNAGVDGNKLVVSCGTAITIDRLSGGGDHLGGYIIPGLGLMQRMLHTNTAQLPRVEVVASTVLPGKNTLDCINNGILAMAVAMINTQQAGYEASLDNACEDSVVYLAGGDAALIQPYIQGECRYHPELVMDGLALAFVETVGIEVCA